MRELRNIVIRLTTKYAGQRLSLVELEPEFDLEAPQPAVARRAATSPSRRSASSSARRVQTSTRRSRPGSAPTSRRRCELTRGNVSQAAKLLGMNRTTLYSRMNTGEDK